MMVKDKYKVAVVVLAVLLVLSLGYIGFTKYMSVKSQRDVSIFKQGVGAGYQQAILQLIEQASTCQPVPVFAGNVTVNLMAVECLKEESVGQPVQPGG